MLMNYSNCSSVVKRAHEEIVDVMESRKGLEAHTDKSKFMVSYFNIIIMWVWLCDGIWCRKQSLLLVTAATLSYKQCVRNCPL